MSRRIRPRKYGVEHDRGDRARDRKFKPLVLSEVQAAADRWEFSARLLNQWPVSWRAALPIVRSAGR
jgi:hypothetical protein